MTTKFKEGDKILQVSGYPNAICYSPYTTKPAVATVEKITPKMYRLNVDEGIDTAEIQDVRIEEVERDFCFYTIDRFEELSKLYNSLRSQWSTLYLLQLNYHMEDKVM